jgi:Leucine-rich repeat (LRR) protein
LDFWDNGLSDLPQDLYSLSTLESLRVCDDLRQLSPRISELKQLRKLDLADNRLETLPPSLQTLPHLAYIDLSGNYLDVFPEFLLQMPALQYLDVRNNTKNLVQPQIISDFERLGITILY